jgi:hypothetical protein
MHTEDDEIWFDLGYIVEYCDYEGDGLRFSTSMNFSYLNKLIMQHKSFYVALSTVLTATTILSVMNWFKLNDSNKSTYPEYSYAYDCIKEAELKYWETKSNLCEEVQKYILSVAPTSNLRGYAVVEECEKFNIDIKFVLAQGEIESHFATKGIGGKLNNVFNVGVFDGLSSESVNSTYKYSYPNESIRPYLDLLHRRYLINKLEADLMDNYVDIDGKRYATDTAYENKLKEKYTYISMHTKIDSLQQQMINYAIKCGRL